MNDDDRRKLAKEIVDEVLDRMQSLFGGFVFSKLFSALIILVVIASIYFGLIDVPNIKGG